MLIKKSTHKLMYKAGNKKVQELINDGESLEGFTKAQPGGDSPRHDARLRGQ